jgi:hypothetical protein
MWAYHRKHYNPKHAVEGPKGNDPNKAKKRETVKIVKKG